MWMWKLRKYIEIQANVGSVANDLVVKESSEFDNLGYMSMIIRTLI